MFQPVGGMDRIPYAFAHSLGNVVRYNSPVTEIRKTPDGVRVSYRKGESGPIQSVEAPFCICAMPLTILKTIPNDFAPRVKSAIEQVSYYSAYKVAGVAALLGAGWGRNLRRHLVPRQRSYQYGLVSQREDDVEARSARLRLRHGELD